MTDFQGSTYKDYENSVDIFALNGVFKKPYCFYCGLETSNINSRGIRSCKSHEANTSSATASMTDYYKNENNEHNDTEYRKATA